MAPAVNPGGTSFLLEAYYTCKDFETGSKMKGMEAGTRILGFEFGATSPHDQSTGQTTGRVQVKPLVIHKFVDKSSPLILQALVTNKMINECKVTYYANKVDGTGKIKQFEITLSKFLISSYNSEASAGEHGVIERFDMTYDKLLMIDVPSTKQVEYEWTQALA